MLIVLVVVCYNVDHLMYANETIKHQTKVIVWWQRSRRRRRRRETPNLAKAMLGMRIKYTQRSLVVEISHTLSFPLFPSVSLLNTSTHTRTLSPTDFFCVVAPFSPSVCLSQHCHCHRRRRRRRLVIVNHAFPCVLHLVMRPINPNTI